MVDAEGFPLAPTRVPGRLRTAPSPTELSPPFESLDKKITRFTGIFYGGRRGIRTPDPLGVNEML